MKIINTFIWFFYLLFSISSVSAKVDIKANTHQSVDENPLSDIFIQTQYASDYLETLRAFLQKEKVDQQLFRLGNITIEEARVFASTLQFKVNRLKFELTRTKDVVDEMNYHNSFHEVQEILSMTTDALSEVTRELGQSNAPQALTKQSNDIDQIVAALISANQQADALLEQPITVGHIFQQIISGINYSASILESLNDVSQRIPDSPKKPADHSADDVYQLLLESFAIMNKLHEKLGITSVDVISKSGEGETVRNSTLYDLSRLLISEISYLHDIKYSDKSVPISLYPGEMDLNKLGDMITVLNTQLISLLNAKDVNALWSETLKGKIA